MKPKESWIEETLNSLDGIRRATPEPAMLHALLQVNNFAQKGVGQHKRSFYWSIAAGTAIMISLNIMGALYYYHEHDISQQAPAAIATDYLSYLGPIKL